MIRRPAFDDGMTTMDTISASDLHMDGHDSRGRPVTDVIAYGSIAMIAAAAGLGVFYEAGAAGWLSATAGSATALALFAGHSAFAAPKIGPKKRRAVILTAPTGAVGGAGVTAKVPTNGTEPPRAVAPITPARQPTHGLPPPKIASAAVSAKVTSVTKPDIELAQLEALVRQMADSVPGPKATEPDPDRVPKTTSQPPRPSTDTTVTRANTGAAAVAADMGALVAAAVATERVDVLLAPIQSLSEHRARHFEVMIRLRDEHGHVLSDIDVAEAARRTGLAGAIDVLRLPRVARVARKVQSRAGTPADVLTNVFGDSLADKHFIDALDQCMAGPTPPPMVLSFSQADIRNFGRVHWWALATLADIGLSFAVADVTDLDMDFDLLAARGFAFAKLDALVFLDGLPHGTSVIPAADLTRHLSTVGLQIIVARIEAHDQLQRVAACGVGLGQGSLFGEPKPVRREILEG